MKKFFAGTFEGFIFPLGLLITLLFLIGEVMVLTPWFITVSAHNMWVNYGLVMGVLSFPVGMWLVCFRPNYGNETWLARLYNKHYTKKLRCEYFAFNGVMGYMIMTSIEKVFDKVAQSFLLVGGLVSVVMLAVITLVYQISRTKLNRA
jgi:hypothetical protein